MSDKIDTTDRTVPCEDALQENAVLMSFLLKAANAVVRSNAACLLVDAFPLQDSSLARAEAEL